MIFIAKTRAEKMLVCKLLRLYSKVICQSRGVFSSQRNIHVFIYSRINTFLLFKDNKMVNQRCSSMQFRPTSILVAKAMPKKGFRISVFMSSKSNCRTGKQKEIMWTKRIQPTIFTNTNDTSVTEQQFCKTMQPCVCGQLVSVENATSIS